MVNHHPRSRMITLAVIHSYCFLYVLNNKEVRNISNTECTLALRGH